MKSPTQKQESQNETGTQKSNSPEQSRPDKIESFGEKQETQKFWRRLIFDVFGIINQDEYIEFEKRVLVGRTKFIDAYIPSTGIVIEQKSQGVDLTLPERQSDGSLLTPFEQAKRYYDWLPVSQKGG